MTKPSPFCYFKTSPEVIRLAVMTSGLVSAFPSKYRRTAARAQHRYQSGDDSVLAESVKSNFRNRNPLETRSTTARILELTMAFGREFREDQW